MAEFLKNFWGYVDTVSPVKYSFTWRHLIIFFAVMAFVIFFSMYYFRKSENRQRIFIILACVILLIVEIVRLVWNQTRLKGLGKETTFWSIANLDLFHLTLWVAIFATLLALAMGYKKRFSQYLLNFIFSVTAVVAIIDIIYPITLDNSTYMIYHFTNLEYIISRATVILIAMFIGSSDWLANSIDDMWMAITSLIFVFAVGAGVYFLSGKAIDVIYITGCPWIEMTGIHIASPWHLCVVALFFFFLQIMMYLPFDIYRKVHHKEIVDYNKRRY